MALRSVDIWSAGSATSGLTTSSILPGSIKRQVALDVDDDVAVEVRRNLGNTVGARPMRATRHSYDAAEPLDGGCNPLVVGGDDHGVNAAGVGRAAIDVLDHRLAGDVGQRLSGEARGVVSGGDDGDGAKGL